MSRAAVSAKKAAATAARKAEALERFFAMVDYTAQVDSAVVTCDGCGFGPQVTHGGSKLLGPPHRCFMCNGEVGTSAAC